MATQRSRVGFVLEQSLGHVTHAQNLRRWIARDAALEPDWMWVPYHAPDAWERVPGMPFSLKLSLRARGLVRGSLARRPLDGLYFHTQGLTLCSPGLMRSLPTVVSLDATPENFKSIAPGYGARPAAGIAGRVKAAWFRSVFARARGLVCFSAWVRESLLRDYGVSPDKIRLVRSGVDIREWQPGARAPAQGRRLRLLFVGAAFARKGGHVLLRAFRERLSEACELDIVTRDESIAPQRSIRVHCGLAPNAPLLKQLYAQADLFVLPTQGDATPFAVLEAMACALPVITTDVGALAELVQNGVTGYLVPQGDAQAIADRVLLLARERERLAAMGAAARLAVERDFNAETNYRRLIAFIKEIVAPQPGRD